MKIFTQYKGLARAIYALAIGRMVTNMGATIYGTVMSVSCLLVVILTPIITQIVEERSNQWKLIAGVTAQIISFAVFLASMGHFPAYYLAIGIFIKKQQSHYKL